MSQAFDFLRQNLDGLAQAGALRSLCPVSGSGLPLIRREGRTLVNFGSNDYLGLAAERLERTDQANHRGAGASPLVCGYTEDHHRLCQMLADLEQTEAAVLFPSGYAACSGAVAALPQAGDLILSDRLNHASLIDGCRLSAANKIVYPHADAEAVRQLLADNRSKYQRVWIVTDTVFGMDGDLAPLPQLCDLAEQYDALLIVDEAHATGVLGDDGSGACAQLGVKSRVPIRIGTLSKAVGAQGGFVVGPKVVIDYLVNYCRPLIFSTASSPLVIAAAIEGIESIRSEPHRRHAVARIARLAREILKGESVWSPESDVPIVPVMLSRNDRALEISRRVNEFGYFVPAIRPPTVPDGTARLRISLSAVHREQDLIALLSHLREFGVLPSV
jgi:8-amino-7-oxononanoate synthase